MMNREHYKSALKRYARIEKSIEAEVFAQMNKPRALRDSLYIDECLETISYVSITAQKLESGCEGEAPLYSGSRLRRAIIAATLSIIVLTSVSGIAEALGLRVWNAIVKRDPNYFQISYIPSAYPDPSMTMKGMNGEDGGVPSGGHKFASMDQAIQALDIDPPLPTILPEGMEIEYPVEGYASGLQRWMVFKYQGDGHYLRFQVNMESDGISGIILPRNDGYEIYESRGLEHHIVVFCTEYKIIWHTNEYRILMQTNLDIEEVKLVIDSLR